MGRGDGLDGLLTSGQVARILGVKGSTTVWHHVRKGNLKVERRIVQGDRTLALFDPTEVKRLAQKLKDRRNERKQRKAAGKS